MWIPQVALLVALASSWYMAGLIAFVDRVHYPLFASVEPASFPAYHAGHTRRTTGVVLVPMALELIAAAVLVARRPPGVGRWLAWSGLAAAGLTWVVTGLASVPAHRSLASGFDPSAYRRLMSTDRLRVAGWFGHALICTAMAARSMRWPEP